MITRTDIAAHLEKGIRTGFVIGQKSYSPLRGPFCGVKPSDGAFEVYGDMGATPWPQLNAGKQGSGGTDGRTGAQVSGAMSMGRQITILGGEEKNLVVYNQDWEVTIGIEHNAINDDRAGDLEDWAKTTAVNYEKHKDYLAFNALNNAAATTVLSAGYDKVALLSPSHVDPGAEYQTAQDNDYALALSMSNLLTVKIAASKFLDGRGHPLGLNHSLLIHPSDLMYEAAQILRNAENYETGNRATNPFNGRLSGLEAPGAYLDSTAWFLVDPTMPQKPLYLQERQAPQLTIWDVNDAPGGGVRFYKWHSRYTIFPGDWRLIVGGNS